MARRIFIDTFSSLDELPKKHHGDPEKVLNVLRKEGRFSTFEMAESPTLWRTVDGLRREGRIELDNNTPYPWTLVTVRS